MDDSVGTILGEKDGRSAGGEYLFNNALQELIKKLWNISTELKQYE